MKIVLLFSAFVLIVNGRTLEKGQNKRYLILNALSNIRKKDIWFPQQIIESPDVKPPQYGLSEKVGQIQNILDMLKQYLDYFKAMTLKNHLLFLSSKLNEIVEDIFYNPFIAAIDQTGYETRTAWFAHYDNPNQATGKTSTTETAAAETTPSSTTTGGNAGTSPGPSSTTESIVVRRKTFLRRELLDLLLQKEKTAVRRGGTPQY